MPGAIHCWGRFVKCLVLWPVFDFSISPTVPPHLNADGFGIGWYVDTPDDENIIEEWHPEDNAVGGCGEGNSIRKQPALHAQNCFLRLPIVLHTARLKRHETPGIYTSIAPAWNDDNLFQISEKVRSSCIFAHVRAASLGSPVTQVNTHPFAAHRYIFMHNGYLANFEKMRKSIIALIDDEVYRFVQGTSDSEHCFGLFLTELLKDGPLQNKATSSEMQAAMCRTLRLLESICAKHAVADGSMLNFCVSDGATVIATKHVIGAGPAASLYFSCGSGWEAVKGVRGQYRMARHDRREEVVIVASEKLTDEAEDWINIPRNHMVVITPSLNVLVVPTDEAAAHEAMAGAAVALPIPDCLPDCSAPCTPIAAVPAQDEVVLSDEIMREHRLGALQPLSMGTLRVSSSLQLGDSK